MFARIVRIADAFDAGTSHTVYRQARSQARILHEMTVGAYRSYFDPVILKVFATLIQPFPIGAKIRLSNGTGGVVVRHNPVDPFNPQIIVAFGPDGRALPPDDLSKPVPINDMRGVKMIAFGGDDLSFLYNEEALSPIRIDRQNVTDLFGMMYP